MDISFTTKPDLGPHSASGCIFYKHQERFYNISISNAATSSYDQKSHKFLWFHIHIGQSRCEGRVFEDDEMFKPLKEAAKTKDHKTILLYCVEKAGIEFFLFSTYQCGKEDGKKELQRAFAALMM